jgi:hypothetical protein
MRNAQQTSDASENSLDEAKMFDYTLLPEEILSPILFFRTPANFLLYAEPHPLKSASRNIVGKSTA